MRYLKLVQNGAEFYTMDIKDNVFDKNNLIEIDRKFSKIAASNALEFFMQQVTKYFGKHNRIFKWSWLKIDAHSTLINNIFPETLVRILRRMCRNLI